MIRYTPKVIPISVWPGDWCINCQDPDHSSLELCNILTLRRDEQGKVSYEPCGCVKNLVFGRQGEYLVAVTRDQKE